MFHKIIIGRLLIAVNAVFLAACASDETSTYYFPYLSSCKDNVEEWKNRTTSAKNGPFVDIRMEEFWTNYYSYPELSGVIILEVSGEQTSRAMGHLNFIVAECASNKSYSSSNVTEVFSGIPSNVRSLLNIEHAPIKIDVNAHEYTIYYREIEKN